MTGSIIKLVILGVLIPSPAFADDYEVLRNFKTVLWPLAYRTQDVELLDRLLHDSFEMIDAEGNRSTKAQELEYITANQWDPGTFEYRIERLQIYQGSFAVIAGTGIAERYSYKSSNFLVKEDGVWRAIASHVSGIERTGERSPGPRFGHEMVYDEARDEIVLFGGFGSDGIPKGDTWIWDGASWRLAASDGPSPRKWAAAAYDARREVVVLHGGREGAGRSGPSLDDTWLWDGHSWEQIPIEGPTPRDHHRAVYDKARDRVVIYGGWNGVSLESDTWEWDGSRWERTATDGPGARAPYGMTYHESLQTVVLAGGQDLDQAFADMWTWDGDSWRRLESDVPSSRGFHAMAYMPGADSIVLFGGRNGDKLLNDMWTWQRGKWTRISVDGPLRRGIYASAYDRRRDQFLFHGGGNLVEGKWVLNPQTWLWSADSGWRAAHRSAR